jgi:exodeoxyribonuclease VII large subunit
MTVAELCRQIDASLRSAFPSVWVRGEISGLRIAKSGHAYFTLKDPEAVLRAVMWRTTLSRLRFRPEDGIEVVVRGRAGFYAGRSEAQIVVEEMEVSGLGALQAAFEQLKARLQTEGLFDPARKRPVPELCRTVGVVTSPDGAALRDFLRIAHRRNPNLRVIVSPTLVQGPEAKTQIILALDRLERLWRQGTPLDAVVVTRGGGSLEDLWPFNEEEVARRIATFPLPVVSAVGHEVDFTIADFVADLRAPTPSAAAERLALERGAALRGIEGLRRRLLHGLRGALHEARHRLRELFHREGLADFPRRAEDLARRLDEAEASMGGGLSRAAREAERQLHALALALQGLHPRERMLEGREALGRLTSGMRHRMREILSEKDRRLALAAEGLERLSPLAVLARGYSICYAEDGRTVVRSARSVRVLDRVAVRLSDGTLACDVREKH